MAAFHYIALTVQGRTQRGVLEADTPKQARQLLRQQSLSPISVTAVSTRQPFYPIKRFSQRRFNLTTLALVTRQLATLIAASMPLEEALLAVAEQAEKPVIKDTLSAIRAKLLEGFSLADSLKQFPQNFSSLYCATVAAGEQTGQLDTILLRLADYIERQQHIHQKVQQALIYPSIMLLTACAIVGFLLSYVVPKIISIFDDSGQSLPPMTQLLLSISHGLSQYGIYLIISLAIGLWAGIRLLRRPSWRYRFDKCLLSLPLLGKAISTLNTARYARTLATLMAGGVSVLEAMRVSNEVLNNQVIYQAIHESHLKVREGISIHQALKQTHYFPAMTIHLIANGEASGKLDEMLERAANSQDQAMMQLIDISLSLFEPGLILIMGGIVLFIVLAILLPIFDLNQLIT